MKNYKNLYSLNALAVLICLGFVGSLQGCATASSVNMIPDSYDINTKIGSSVYVQVDTSQANTHYHDRVDEGAFQNALKESLIKSGLFEKEATEAAAKYQLLVKITSVGNFWGLTAKLTINTTWTLTDTDTNRAVWKDVVRSEGIATMDDDYGGFKRVSIAYERGISKNIRAGINLLSGAGILTN